jgi:hypothetical protein
MMGVDDGSSEIPPVANQNLWVQACQDTLSIPQTMVKWVNVISKQLSEIKGVRCIYLKVIMIKNDTYHDTWTNYLMEQEFSLIQVQAEGDGCCCCRQDESDEREERWALQGHAQVNPALCTPCLGPVGLET